MTKHTPRSEASASPASRKERDEENERKRRALTPAPPGATTPEASPPKAPDSLKTLMPAGEAGARNPTAGRAASQSGGTSGAEDTTRTAGYVADLATTPEAPPGPPIAKDPALTTRPEKAPAPPAARPSPPAATGKPAAGSPRRKGPR